jgi:RNA polymerase sigma factor (sigma-70 family)
MAGKTCMESTEQLVRNIQSSTDEKERNKIFNKLYKRHIKLIYYAANKFKNGLTKEDIEDVARETLIYISEELDHFHWKVEKAFTTWIHNIAYNKASEELRRKKRRKKKTEQASQSNILNNPESTEPMARLFDLWRKFDPEGYELNYLFHSENQSDKTIASKINISEEAVRQRRTRAAEKFKIRLKQHYGVDSVEDWIELYNYKKREKKGN